jgi:hypothetical protein
MQQQLLGWLPGPACKLALQSAGYLLRCADPAAVMRGCLGVLHNCQSPDPASPCSCLLLQFRQVGSRPTTSVQSLPLGAIKCDDEGPCHLTLLTMLLLLLLLLTAAATLLLVLGECDSASIKTAASTPCRCIGLSASVVCFAATNKHLCCRSCQCCSWRRSAAATTAPTAGASSATGSS